MSLNTIVQATINPVKPPKLTTPTVKRGKSGWCITNSSLGCGTRVLQGWSEGIGIANNADFEKKFFQLLYLSRHPEHIEEHWIMEGLGRSTEAPIGITMNRYQLLTPHWTYTFNSLEHWSIRFKEFVDKHCLGVCTLGHAWVNFNYQQHTNITGTWTWNGNVPKAVAVGYTDWKLPE